MKKQVNWDAVEFLLSEALEGLNLLYAQIETARTGVVPRGYKKMIGGDLPINEEHLRFTVGEAYRKLNFVWNARYCSPQDMDKDYDKKCRFPALFTREMNLSKKGG